MVHQALTRNYAVVDATQGVLAIHQNHDYAHLKGGKLESSRGKEAEKNKAAGGYNFQGTIADCTRQYIPVLVPNKPRIGIVIPTYNQSDTLGLAIESVLNQTYTDYEIIVVDDGSSDGTREMLQPYYSHIHYIPQEHQGILSARNRGIASSQSELVGFLDADCFFLPNKLEEQIALFDRRGSLEVVHSGWKVLGSDGKVATKQPWNYLPSLNPDELHVWKTWMLWSRFPASAMIFRRTHLNTLNGFDVRLEPQVAEIDLALRSALKGGLTSWLKKPTYCDREQNSELNIDKIASSFDTMLTNFFQRAELSEWMPLLHKQATYLNSVWLAWLFSVSDRSEEAKTYLQQSLEYSDRPEAEVRHDWEHRFATFSREYGLETQLDLSNAI